MKLKVYWMDGNLERHYYEVPVPNMKAGADLRDLASSVLIELANNGSIKDYQVELMDEGR